MPRKRPITADSPPERIAARKRQLAMLATHGQPTIPAGEPRLTPETAHEFVKLLHAGLPQLRAMAYLAPEYDRTISKTTRRMWQRRWMNDPILLEATTRLNGGQWVALDPDKRLEIALDKHYAELAYFLYTHDYAQLEEVELKKADVAREALSAKLTASQTEGEDAPWTRFMRDLLDGKVSAVQPPQLQPEVVPVPGVKKES